ncbi:N-acetylneuraminate synthase [Metabacillus elymi]|uniref:N-acetylneuraminate synthase n=1 Tax=Metabacillus elymi TaxID=2745198 RepID=A0ABX6S304_9BACI|nr:N-acetylneuraminate synthase [Metabacillus sp. KUDC1714]QNF28480.1 N-acetylneuraminate synthase [Metabacillus sp. KUDC1714]
MQFKIKDHIINKKSPTYIIAEIGVNHNGDVEIARKSIDAAFEAGADAVKFQTYKSNKLVSKYAEKAQYQKENTQDEETQFEMLQKLEVSANDFIFLKNYCDDKGIEFLSSPFDEDSAEFLKNIGVNVLKIGSGELTNIHLFKKISQYKLPIILSTGMASLGEIEDALNVLEDNEVALLHCTSNYPAPYEDINLNAIITMKNAFGKIIGYSDHSVGIEVSISAVSLGAKIIEKHFTIDKSLPGPDHKSSLNPQEFSNLVKSIRNVEKSLGNGIKKCMPSEQQNKMIVRKSIVANQCINKGEILTKDNMTFKRPGGGIAPKNIDVLIGRKVKNSIKEDQIISWEDLL